MMTCSQTRIAELETRIAELEKENEKLSGKYSDLWHYGCNDDLSDVHIVKMLLEKGEKERVMDVWSDVYEENRDHFEFNEDSEDEDDDEEKDEDTDEADEESSDEDTDDEQENDEQKTYTTNALLYGKNHNLKYWQCIGTGTNGKVTLPNMIALKKSCTCHFCGYVEEDSKQSDQLVCGCNVCNLPLCDHCRATDGEDDVDDSICQACYDKSKEEEDE
tara:strand:+ start:1065 stop:1718 length:654 start_codon:yes stop_codon:yes gene_type:complete